MTERWQERRVENELLKRELLLRLRAEHSAVPGRGEPATDYFRRRVGRLLLRHPIFALKLYLLLLDVGLGRADGAERSYLPGRADAPRVGAIARSARANSPGARLIKAAAPRRIRVARESNSMPTSLMRAGRQQRLLMYTRLLRLQQTGGSVLVRLKRGLRSQRLVLRGHLPWKSKLGLSGVRRSPIESTATRAPARTCLRRVAGAVIAGVALTPLAAIAVVATRNVGSNGKPEAARSGNPQSANQIAPGFLHFPANSTRTAGAHASPRPARHAERTTARTARRAKPRVTQRLTLVSNTVETASVPAAPAASTAATASHTTGPSPIPAPPGVSGPGPLKAPQG
jgi:hypothetical protein